MAAPLVTMQGAPTFGGMTGYKRSAPGDPTSVPGAMPAFRGERNEPTQKVVAPSIRASYNRQDRGSNVTVPYARVVLLDEIRYAGRVEPGDVVFCQMHDGAAGFGHASTTRLAGIDYLNAQLGGRKEHDAGVHKHRWQVGRNVLLGGKAADLRADAPRSIQGLENMAIGDHDRICDGWRMLTLLKEWACDGVVLSNDTPECYNSGGEHDAQLFNICVQGVCPLNNGYMSRSGGGVDNRGVPSATGWSGGGSRSALGTGPIDTLYPLQMFDRKIRPLDDVYVGLVATRRVLDEDARQALQKNGSTESDLETVAVFYTFHFVPFSSRQAYAMASGTSAAGDAFAGISRDEWKGMVGAWHIGTVLDNAARTKMHFSPGPKDRVDGLTVNVCVRFCDWRALRHTFHEQGGDEANVVCVDVPGAASWKTPTTDALKDVLKERLEERTKTINGNGNSEEKQQPLHWPTEYDAKELGEDYDWAIRRSKAYSMFKRRSKEYRKRVLTRRAIELGGVALRDADVTQIRNEILDGEVAMTKDRLKAWLQRPPDNAWLRKVGISILTLGKDFKRMTSLNDTSNDNVVSIPAWWRWMHPWRDPTTEAYENGIVPLSVDAPPAKRADVVLPREKAIQYIL